MNGANALPAVSEMMTPSIRRRRMSGSSQNFFRILRKPHISRRIEAYLTKTSVCVPVAFDRVLGLGLVDPVRGLAVLPLEIERPLAEETHHQSVRRHDEEEENAEDD